MALSDPELAVLSAIAHGSSARCLDVLGATFRAFAALDKDHAAAYFWIVYGALKEPLREALEKIDMSAEAIAKLDFPPFMQRLIDYGKQEGLLEGERKGLLEGERKGKIEGVRDTLLRLLAQKAVVLSETDYTRVATCTDEALLARWIDNVLNAKSAEDVFR